MRIDMRVTVGSAIRHAAEDRVSSGGIAARIVSRFMPVMMMFGMPFPW